MKGYTQLATATLVAAVSFTTPAAAAGRRSAFRFRNAEQSWQPAHETATPASAATHLDYVPHAALYDGDSRAFMNNVPLRDSVPPAPTTAPTSPFDHTGRLLARANSLDTCGFVDAEFTSPIYCNANYECVVNSNNFVIGCCPSSSSSCPVQTACVAKTAVSLTNSVNSYILTCSDVASPECVTYAYTGADYYGYNAYGCATASGKKPIEYHASDSSSSFSSSITATTSATTSSTSATTSSSSAASTTASSNSSKSSNHAGAIAGGVVGGIAGLAIIALAGFFFYRHSQKKKANLGGPGTPGVAPGGQPPYGNDPPPQQAQYYPPNPQSPQQFGYGYVPVATGAAAGAAVAGAAYTHNNEPHAAYGVAQSTSPLSAGAPSSSTPGTLHEPAAPYQSPTPAHGMGFQSGPVPTYDVPELSTERPDSELRELA
ncbi:hypothetical protein CMQ_6236 [Grosmannia clavigera kw1407]|uniref:Uncharacterized protein n=1 Tax=Grosmannia clavigera (strain kw1407 / UAMH 11150) TaxID=655863 RepID=F0XLY5_GROCL|nr:uncharacterized protein CMQ_6236 [Grosmannia clavigera kw1407]EFX01294.1 hypothetical protein CMQ_6236 [Grosmannia clavigera kw1407]